MRRLRQVPHAGPLHARRGARAGRADDHLQPDPDDVLPDTPDVSTDEVQEFYDANIAQFEQPESRDIRVILTKTEAEAKRARGAAEGRLRQVVQEGRQQVLDRRRDQVNGGLRQGVVRGSPTAADDQSSRRPPNQLVGPFKGDTGFYVIEVAEDHPGGHPAARPTSTTRSSRRCRPAAADRPDFQDDFRSKWIARTFCADGFRDRPLRQLRGAPARCTGSDRDDRVRRSRPPRGVSSRAPRASPARRRRSGRRAGARRRAAPGGRCRRGSSQAVPPGRCRRVRAPPGRPLPSGLVSTGAARRLRRPPPGG